MAPFDFIMVLVSILVGLGIAELLGGVARVYRSRPPARVTWIQWGWIYFLFLYLVGIWWSRWDMRAYREWTLFDLLFDLASPALALVACGILFPEEPAGADLREYYYARRRPFFVVLATAVAISLLHEIFREGLPWLGVETGLALILLAGLIAPIRIDRPWVHAASVLIAIVGTTAFILTSLSVALR